MRRYSFLGANAQQSPQPEYGPGMDDADTQELPMREMMADAGIEEAQADQSGLIDLRETARPKMPRMPAPTAAGQMPPGALGRMLSELTVLIKYGHGEQAQYILDHLVRGYPEDLKTNRRVAEFQLENRLGSGVDTLFVLATRLLERGRASAVRRVLQRITAHEPDSARAARMLEMLEKNAAG